MTVLTEQENELILAGFARRLHIDVMHCQGRDDAYVLRSVIGRRVQTRGDIYVVCAVRYTYSGHMAFDGHRILKTGEIGKRVFDLGPVKPARFIEDPKP